MVRCRIGTYRPIHQTATQETGLRRMALQTSEIERMWTIFVGLRDPSPARTCGTGAKSIALDKGTICSMRAPVAICQAGEEHPFPQATCCASGRLKGRAR